MTRPRAFTLVELLVIIGIAGVFFLMFSLREHGDRAGQKKNLCTTNLKITGTALSSYAQEHDGRMPWQKPDAPVLQIDSPRLESWQYFMSLESLLDSPRRLVCPDDVLRLQTRAASFTGHPDSLAARRNLAVSYFIGLNGGSAQPGSLLLGDRNIVPQDAPDFRQSPASTISDVDPQTATWWQGTGQGFSFHNEGGNISHYDGSVKTTSTDQLRAALKKARDAYGTNANRFLFPQ